MFQKLLVADLAKALLPSMKPEQIKVLSLRSGSIVAEVRFSGPGAAQAAKNLVAQANDTDSALFRGKVTDKTELGSAELVSDDEATQGATTAPVTATSDATSSAPKKAEKGPFDSDSEDNGDDEKKPRQEEEQGQEEECDKLNATSSLLSKTVGGSGLIKLGQSMLPDRRSDSAKLAGTLGRDTLLAATRAGPFGETLKPGASAAAEYAASSGIGADDDVDEEEVEGDEDPFASGSNGGGSGGKFGATMCAPLSTTFKNFSMAKAVAVEEEEDAVSVHSEHSSSRSNAKERSSGAKRRVVDDGNDDEVEAANEELEASAELPKADHDDDDEAEEKSDGAKEEEEEEDTIASAAPPKYTAKAPPSLKTPDPSRASRSRDVKLLPASSQLQQQQQPHPPPSASPSASPQSGAKVVARASSSSGGMRKFKPALVPAEALGHQRAKKAVPIADDEFGDEEEQAKLWRTLTALNKPVPAQKWAKHAGATGRIQSPPPLSASIAPGGIKPPKEPLRPSSAAGARPTSARIHAATGDTVAGSRTSAGSAKPADDEFATDGNAAKELANFKAATAKPYAIKGREVQPTQQPSPSRSKLRGSAADALGARPSTAEGRRRPSMGSSERPDSARSAASSSSLTTASASTAPSTNTSATSTARSKLAWSDSGAGAEEAKEQTPVVDPAHELDESHPAVQAAAKRLLAKALAAASAPIAAKAGKTPAALQASATKLLERVAAAPERPASALVRPARNISAPRGGLAPAAGGADSARSVGSAAAAALSARSVGSNLSMHSDTSEHALHNVLAKPTRIAPPSGDEMPVVPLPARKVIAPESTVAALINHVPGSARPSSAMGLRGNSNTAVRATPAASPLGATVPTPLRTPSSSSSASLASSLGRYPAPVPAPAFPLSPSSRSSSAASVATAASSSAPAAPLSPLKDPAHVQNMMRVIEAEVAALRAAAAQYEARRTHPSATVTFTPAPNETRNAPLPLQTNLARDASVVPHSQYHPAVPPLRFAQPTAAAAAARVAVQGNLPPNPRTPLLSSGVPTGPSSFGADALPAGTPAGARVTGPNKAPVGVLDAEAAYKNQMRRREITQPKL
jgi:hypothetical protein